MKKTENANYRPPQVWITRVALESGIAVTVSVDLYDWEDGGTIGENPELEGGDIMLF